MNQLLAIAIGGSLGAVARFLAANGIYAWLGRGFPLGTLFVNVAGSFLMGLLAELMLQRFPVAAEVRAGVLVGFLGAFTTFSTFALESLHLINQGGYLKAILNLVLSPLLCVLAVWIGIVWARTLFTGMSPAWTAQGLAWLGLLLGGGVLFALALLATLAFHHFGWPPTGRAVMLILLLGLATVAATLWMALRLGDVPLELGGLFSIFMLNGLAAATLLWLASQLGNWLWQLTPSR